jgi:hypothetical protein
MWSQPSEVPGSYKVASEHKDYKQIILARYKEEQKGIKSTDKEFYIDENGRQHKYVVVDGRKIKPTLYPAGFDFSLLKCMNIRRNEPLQNFNNMVMDVHIVDESKIVSKRGPFDTSQLLSDLEEPNDYQFLSQQYRINQYEMNRSKMSSNQVTPRHPLQLRLKNLSS